MICSLESRLSSPQRERGAAAAVTYAFIETNKADFPIAFMCARLGCPGSGSTSG